MTRARVRPVLAAGWRDALRRGSLAFLAIAALGQALAIGAWAIGIGDLSLVGTARLGWLYFGAFHHVAIESRGPIAIGVETGEPAELSLGVALLAVTGVAAWLLFRAGRDVANRSGGETLARVLHGAKVAPAYALPALPLALLLQADLAVDLGPLGAEQRLSLSPWQAFLFPFAVAGVAGAAGGLRSALEHDRSRARLLGAATDGGWWMLLVSLALAYAGLLAAGVVQPDAPVALATPASARYYQEALASPEVGALVLVHHLGLAPNEAVWTLVPAMGACDGVWGTERVDFLCYRRFPTSVDLLPPRVFPLLDVADVGFGKAPVAYLLFLLVPAAASVFGGRRAAKRLGEGGWRSSMAGALAGVVFAALVAAMATISLVTVSYRVGTAPPGRLIVGPDVPAGAVLALGWGVVGGAAGAATTFRARWKVPAGPRAGTRPR